MTEISPSAEIPRLLTNEQVNAFSNSLFAEIANESWKEQAYANEPAVKSFLTNGIQMIQEFEEATHQKHPKIHTDTDVIYIDSGPGPYSYNMLEPGKKDLDDVNYHKWKWSRKMDRARIRAAYTLASMITAKRIKEQTGTIKSTKDLTPEDFERFGPYLMYTSVDWQASHIKHALSLAREAETFKIPDSKLVMYEEFTSREGKVKPIVHTQDQIEGLSFPANPDGSPPRRIAIVSHPAHLMRIMHILGKYPDSIPNGTTLQAFPIPTPKAAVKEYTEGELMGTLATVFKTGRASLTPYTNYEIDTVTAMKKEKQQIVDEAYIFDVDGVLTVPDSREFNREVMEDIAKRLTKDEPVILNTGRSISWVQQRIIARLYHAHNIKDPSVLQNLFVVGEKGGTWLTFDEKGLMHEHKDDSISVPQDLQDAAKRIVDEQFPKTMFFDDTKRTMISTEMKEVDDKRFEGQISLEDFQRDQAKLVEIFKELLKSKGLDSVLEIDPSTIATDIQNKFVGKDFAIRKALAWLSARGFLPKKFVAFGDSKSDVAMAKELYENGQNVEFVFVGNDSDREIIQSANYPFPIHFTDNKFTHGTEEFLKRE